jgi:hypothetical protein
LATSSNALPGLANAKAQHNGPCPGNTPSTRDQWCGYDIHSDYYSVVPDTGVTREYWLEIREITFAPDGVERFAQAINGSIPGMQIPPEHIVYMLTAQDQQYLLIGATTLSST